MTLEYFGESKNDNSFAGLVLVFLRQYGYSNYDFTLI